MTRRAQPARTSSPASRPVGLQNDAMLQLDRTRAARERLEARRHAADDEVRALRERLRREAALAERERLAAAAEAEEASAAARLAAAIAAKERRLAAARAAIATREDAERRRRIAEEVEAAEAEAREAARLKEVERVRAKELVKAAREVEERNARRERTRRMASALGAWRDVALRELRATDRTRARGSRRCAGKKNEGSFARGSPRLTRLARRGWRRRWRDGERWRTSRGSTASVAWCAGASARGATSRRWARGRDG